MAGELFDLDGTVALVTGASRGLGAAMAGLEISTIPENERLANRGW